MRSGEKERSVHESTNLWIPIFVQHARPYLWKRLIRTARFPFSLIGLVLQTLRLDAHRSEENLDRFFRS